MKKIIFALVFLFFISSVCAEKVYLVDLNFNKENVSIDSVYLKEGYAPDRKIQEGNYEFILYDFNKDNLLKFKFDIPNKIFSDVQNNSTLEGGVDILDSGRFSLVVPYDEDAVTMGVHEQGKKVNEFDVSKYSETKKNKNVLYWIIIGFVIGLILVAAFYIFNKVKSLNNSNV